MSSIIAATSGLPPVLTLAPGNSTGRITLADCPVPTPTVDAAAELGFTVVSEKNTTYITL